MFLALSVILISDEPATRRAFSNPMILEGMKE